MILILILFIFSNNVYGAQAIWDTYPELELIMKITYISNLIAIRNIIFRNNYKIYFKEKRYKKFRIYKEKNEYYYAYIFLSSIN